MHDQASNGSWHEGASAGGHKKADMFICLAHAIFLLALHVPSRGLWDRVVPEHAAYGSRFNSCC